MAILQHHTSVVLLAAADLQRRPGGHLEHFPHAVLGLGGTLHVAEGSDPRGHVPAFLRLNRLLLDGKELKITFSPETNFTVILDVYRLQILQLLL